MQEKFEKIVSIAICESNAIVSKVLLLKFKNNIQPDKLDELVSSSIDKMHDSTIVTQIDFNNSIKLCDDEHIRELLVGVKNKIYKDKLDKLDELASRAIKKMSDDNEIRQLLVGIHDKISQEKLIELISIAINKMERRSSLQDLFAEIKDILSEEKLVELASIAIEKVHYQDDMKDLFIEIKDKFSDKELAKLASMAIENMFSIEKIVKDSQIESQLLVTKDTMSKINIAKLANIAIEIMSDNKRVIKLLKSIKDNLSENQLTELTYIATEKMFAIDKIFKHPKIRHLLEEKYSVFYENLTELASRTSPITSITLSRNKYQIMKSLYSLIIIKDNILPEKLTELASSAITKISDKPIIKGLLLNIKDKLPQDQFED